ncbi:hypothetical protein Asi02nite_52290 [Asanoa siamensis]|uniref:DUF11 domain-containing protein n=1 Tax=Asanoa siamensis TaxID=926357 RepID=A0ABQ4CWQ5_9ACTN|nr:hypothetical protein Asi02nite_52290 [Asanoa siamensis]
MSQSAAVSPAAPSTFSTVDVAVTGTMTPAVVASGRDATFTVTARNKGFRRADAVRVAVPLPARIIVAARSASQGVFDGLTWTVGSIGVRRDARLTLRVRATGPVTATATAALISSFPADRDERDDVATAPLKVSAPPGAKVPRADLALTAQVAPTLAGPGDPVTYAVTVTNKGPDAALDVEVADPVLVGTFLTSAATVGQVTGFPPRTGAATTAARWRVGSLAVGASATWTVRTLAVVTGRGDPVVLVTQSGAEDPSPADTVGRAAPVVSAADLSLTREVDNLTPVVGQPVTVTVTAGNAGPDLARGVTVTDPPNDGLVFVSAAASVGRYDEEDGRWLVGDLAAGAEATLTIHARVAVAGALASRATVEARPPDPNGADNLAETVLSTSGGEAPHMPVFRRGFPLPYTEIRLSMMEATVVGGLLIALGCVLLLHVAADRRRV